MIVTAIPDDEVLPIGKRIVVGPPPGHDVTGDIRAAEAMVWRTDDVEAPRYSFRVELEDDDLARLTAGEPVWLTFLGGVMPFYVLAEPPVGRSHHYRSEDGADAISTTASDTVPERAEHTWPCPLFYVGNWTADGRPLKECTHQWRCPE